MGEGGDKAIYELEGENEDDEDEDFKNIHQRHYGQFISKAKTIDVQVFFAYTRVISQSRQKFDPLMGRIQKHLWLFQRS